MPTGRAAQFVPEFLSLREMLHELVDVPEVSRSAFEFAVIGEVRSRVEQHLRRAKHEQTVA